MHSCAAGTVVCICHKWRMWYVTQQMQLLYVPKLPRLICFVNIHCCTRSVHELHLVYNTDVIACTVNSSEHANNRFDITDFTFCYVINTFQCRLSYWITKSSCLSPIMVVVVAVVEMVVAVVSFAVPLGSFVLFCLFFPCEIRVTYINEESQKDSATRAALWMLV